MTYRRELGKVVHARMQVFQEGELGEAKACWNDSG